MTAANEFRGDERQRLVDQYTEIAALAGQLAHEIKNPLSTIRLTMELMAEDFRDSDSARDRRAVQKIATVQRECQRLQDLLDNFLNYAKVRRFDPQPTDLNREVQQLLDFFRPQALEAGIEIIGYFDPDLPTTRLDRESFHGALLNLVINAQQSMPEGGQLVVRTRATPKHVALDLIDSGPGMDEDTRAKIFKTFYSTKRGGSGLGLPIARKIIEAQGGEIFVQSEPGKGTQFTILLPALPRIGTTSESPSRAASAEDASLSDEKK